MTATELELAVADLSEAQLAALLMKRAQIRTERRRDQTASRMAALRDRKKSGDKNVVSDAKVTPSIVQIKRHSFPNSDAIGDAKVTIHAPMITLAKEAGSSPLDSPFPEETSAPRKKTPSGKKKETPPPESVEVPSTLLAQPRFTTVWGEFIQSRKMLKKPMTHLAAERILRTLTEHPEKAVAAMDLAIERGWSGMNWQWVHNAMPAPTAVATASNNAPSEIGTLRFKYKSFTRRDPFELDEPALQAWWQDYQAKEKGRAA